MILLIGGCGYIGSALYTHLKDFQVDTLDLEWFGNFINPNNIKGNYKDYEFEHYQTIVLLAGHSSVKMCNDEPFESFKNNVYNFTKLISRLKKQKLIYASSASVYDGIQQATELSVSNPIGYYDLTKKTIDSYAQLSDIEYYGLRLGTVNGPSPNLRNDIMINKMYSTKEINLYNKDAQRPILGINDLCNCIKRIIIGGDHRGIYNLCSFNASIEGIATTVSQITNAKIIDKGNSSCYSMSVDNSKFKNTYNFEFKDTIESIVEGLLKSNTKGSSR